LVVLLSAKTLITAMVLSDHGNVWGQLGIKLEMTEKSKEIRIYLCPYCNQEIFKGFVTRLTLTCPHCNEFVRIPERVQDPGVRNPHTYSNARKIFV